MIYGYGGRGNCGERRYGARRCGICVTRHGRGKRGSSMMCGIGAGCGSGVM